MPDYIEVPDAGGTKRKISVDELAEALFVQRQKMQFGANGSATDVSSADPLPAYDKAVEEALEAANALLATIDADTGNLSTVVTRLTEIEEDTDRLAAIEISVSLLADAIAGSEMQVDVLTLPELPAGTKAIGQVDPRGNKAHDEADAGNPVKVGARAVTALIAAVANNDRADLTTDKFARLLATVAPLDQLVSGKINFTNTTAADVIAAPGASTALVITGIKVVNSHATVGTKVEILNDATQIDLGGAGPSYGGWIVSNQNGLYPPLTTNKALRAKCLTTGADVDVTAYGYKIPA